MPRSILRVLPLLAVLVVALFARPTCAANGAFDAPPADRGFVPALRTADSLLWARRSADALARAQAIRADAIARGRRWPEMAARLVEAVAYGLGGRAGDCEASARATLALARALREPAYERRATRWIAFALESQGRRAPADSAYRALLRMASAARDTANRGYAELGLAYARSRAGDAAAARPHYVRALACLRAVHDVPVGAMALAGLAHVETRLGHVDAARTHYAEILAAAEANHLAPEAARATNDLGAIEWEAGELGVALEHWRRALAIAREAGDLPDAVIAASNVGFALTQTGDADGAFALYDSLGAVCRAARRQDLANVLDARRVEGLFAQHRFDEAEALLGRIAGLGPNAAEWMPRTTLLRCVVSRSRGRHAEASALAQRELAPRLATMPAALRLESTIELARDLRLGGHVPEALVRATEAESLAIATSQPTLLPAALAELALALRASGAHSAALAAFDRAAAAWRAVREVALDPRWRETRGALGTYLAVERAELQLDGADRDPARIARAFDGLQAHKARTLLERRHGARAAPAPVTLARLRSGVLREGELLLDVHASTARTLVFAVTRRGARLVRLPGVDTLRTRLGAYADLIRTPGADGADGAVRARAATAVASLLLAPFAPELRASRHVVLSCDGALARLPWAELSLPGDAKPLDERASVSFVPSATLLASLRADAPGGGRVLACAGGADAAHPALAGAQREVAWLREHVANVRVRGASAGAPTAADFAGFDVLHFAGHAQAIAERPWESGLLFGSSSASPARGRTPWLTAGRVAAMRTTPSLVVLAGCGTVATNGGVGEGPVGLPNAFLAAGAEAVVGTLWDVDDRTAEAFTRELYPRLVRGQSVAAAAAGARSALRASPATASPSAWAAFVVLGDGERSVPLRAAR